MAKLKDLRRRGYWESLTDDQLLAVELETDDPEQLENLVRELPADYLDSYVEYKYDLRKSGREEFSCVHGHHRRLAGFVMRKGDMRWLVGWQCAASIYGEKFEEYTADYDAAVNRRNTLQKRREIEKETMPFMAWLETVSQSNVFSLYERVQDQLAERLPWVWENAPRASFISEGVDVDIPFRLFNDDIDPRADFARAVSDMSALAANLIGKEELTHEAVQKAKRALISIISRVESVIEVLKEVEDFFQPVVLNMICELGNEHDNPKKRHYIPELLAITCKRGREKITVCAPRHYSLPSRDGLEKLRKAIMTL